MAELDVAELPVPDPLEVLFRLCLPLAEPVSVLGVLSGARCRPPLLPACRVCDRAVVPLPAWDSEAPPA